MLSILHKMHIISDLHKVRISLSFSVKSQDCGER